MCENDLQLVLAEQNVTQASLYVLPWASSYCPVPGDPNTHTT